MIATVLFKKIETPIMISSKLGIEICNPDEYWKEELVQLLKNESEEILNENKDDDDLNFALHNDIRSITQCDYYKVFFHTIGECIEDIAGKIIDNLVCIRSTESEDTHLKLKNEHINNPTCEPCIEDKVIKLYNFLEMYSIFSEEEKSRGIRVSYSDTNVNYDKRLHLLTQMIWRCFDVPDTRYKFYDCNLESDYVIEKLIEFGLALDKFIEKDEDFFALDYILDVLYSDDESNSFTVVKMFSIIELLLINTKESINSQVKNKLPMFVPEDIRSTKSGSERWSKLVYKIRSKIAHGEYIQLLDLTNTYIDEYMKDWWFDYYEFSRINWAYTGVCSDLKRVVGNIIFMTLYNKESVRMIKNS